MSFKCRLCEKMLTCPEAEEGGLCRCPTCSTLYKMHDGKWEFYMFFDDGSYLNFIDYDDDDEEEPEEEIEEEKEE